jgi:hypothetical protein
MTKGHIPSKSALYEIRVKGNLDPQWSDWFDGFTLTEQENDETVLTGPVADQPALHGLLARIRDLGLLLLSVQQVKEVLE